MAKIHKFIDIDNTSNEAIIKAATKHRIDPVLKDQIAAVLRSRQKSAKVGGFEKTEYVEVVLFSKRRRMTATIMRVNRSV